MDDLAHVSLLDYVNRELRRIVETSACYSANVQRPTILNAQVCLITSF